VLDSTERVPRRSEATVVVLGIEYASAAEVI